MTDSSVPWRYIALYCFFAFALFWIPFFGMTIESRYEGAAGLWQPVFGIVGLYSPLLAALIVRILISREGFGDARLGIRQVGWRFWLLALLLPFFWNSVQDALQLWFGFASVDWSQIPNGLYRVPINLFGGFLIFIGEEFGWRSYLLQKLLPLGRFKALFFSGIIWSLWHAPLVIIPNAHYGDQLSVFGMVLALTIFVLFGFIFGWLYLGSKSVWTCVLMHSYNNLIALKLFREAWTVQTEPVFWQTALMAIVPVAMVWLILYLTGQFQTKSNE